MDKGENAAPRDLGVSGPAEPSCSAQHEGGTATGLSPARRDGFYRPPPTGRSAAFT